MWGYLEEDKIYGKRERKKIVISGKRQRWKGVPQTLSSGLGVNMGSMPSEFGWLGALATGKR